MFISYLSWDNDASLCRIIDNLQGVNVFVKDFNFLDTDWASGIAGARGREIFNSTND